MASDRAAGYGDRHAAVYDRIYGARFAPEAAVTALARAAGDGPLLEMGLGTGRLAIPLVERGVEVDGIEGSAAMIERLRAAEGGDRVGVFQVDLAQFDLPRTDYSVAVCAVSTLFMLDHARQRTAVAAAARHLRPGGLLFVEAFRPDPSRFDADGHREESRPSSAGSHVVRSRHDPARRTIHVEHQLGDGADAPRYEVTLCYTDAAGLDAVAAAAGLSLVDRWHDWTGTPARQDSSDPVSVYRR